VEMNCSLCKYRPIGVETLYQIEGNTLCLPCYQRVYTCPGCKQIVTAYLPIGNQKWHPQCYNNSRPSITCAKCRATSSTSFYDIKGLQYCASCFQTFVPCTECGEYIVDAYYPVGTMKYHKHCYEKASFKLFCNNCKIPFGNSQYFELEGKNLCGKCASANLTCARCLRPISGPYTPHNGQKFHPSCMPTHQCPSCRLPITASFILFNGEHWHPECQTRHNQQLTMNRVLERGPLPSDVKVCTLCKEVIVGEFILVGSNQVRHPHCFGPRDSGLHRLK